MIGDGSDRGTRGSGEGAHTFERWYRAHHGRVLAQCRRMLGDLAAAEDVTQETLLRAWLGRERIREEDLGAWLSVVARNLSVSHIRRQKKQVPTEVLPETLDEAADPAHLVERLESRRAVRRALRLVGERDRTVLVKRVVDGAEYEALGAAIGLTAGGARTILLRARRALREQLAASGESVSAFVGGVSVRLRSVTLRGRSAAENAGASLTPALSPAVNFALALGLSFAVFGGGSALGSTPASAPNHASRSAVMPLLVSARSASRDVGRNAVGAVRTMELKDVRCSCLRAKPRIPTVPTTSAPSLTKVLRTSRRLVSDLKASGKGVGR